MCKCLFSHFAYSRHHRESIVLFYESLRIYMGISFVGVFSYICGSLLLVSFHMHRSISTRSAYLKNDRESVGLFFESLFMSVGVSCIGLFSYE